MVGVSCGYGDWFNDYFRLGADIPEMSDENGQKCKKLLILLEVLNPE